MTVLALFDLDHTLLDGDTDVLWCEFLMARSELDRNAFEPRNRAMEERYKAGTVGVREFCEFYVGTLAGRSPAQWTATRAAFFEQCIAPRLLPDGRDCLARHRSKGDTVVLTTATNRFLVEPTASELTVDHLIATECETDAQGRFTGRVAGEPNMREGKLARLQAWLEARGQTLASLSTTFYSDSINDAPLLRAVGTPVAVNPDARLRAEAVARGWAVQHWLPREP
jgi:HAD superfamily hydrolase (TIGR01490 family)